MNKQKGITLIALIITIIVMLILVAVTINVAINGGLFDKAKVASTQTQKQADKEALLSAVVGSVNNIGKVDEEDLETNVLNLGFEISGNDFPYTCISPKGNVFYVYENGKITEQLEQTPVTKQITIVGDNDVTLTSGETEILRVTLPDGIEASNVTWTSSSNVLTVTPSQDKASATITAEAVTEETTVTVTVACEGATSATFTITINSEENQEAWYNVTFKNLDKDEIGNMGWENSDMYMVGFKTKDDVSVLFVVGNGIYNGETGYYYGVISNLNNSIYEYRCLSPWILESGTLGEICGETINQDGTMTFEKLKMFDEEDYTTYSAYYSKLSTDLYDKFITLTPTTAPEL